MPAPTAPEVTRTISFPASRFGDWRDELFELRRIRLRAAVREHTRAELLKRYTHLPQLGLGVAFSWGIPMAFAAECAVLPAALWLPFGAAVLWSVVYDTFYAMVDRDDDIAIGVKSTAILFGDADRLITATLQAVVLLLLWLTGRQFGMGMPYALALLAGAALFAWQQYLIRRRERARCFQAFVNNNLFGLVAFAGNAGDYALR